MGAAERRATPHGSDRRLCAALITHLRRPLVVAAYLLVTILASWAQAQPAVPDEESEPRRGPTWTHASGRTLKLFPGGDVFPIYVADPHRPTNTILVDFTRVDIEDTKSPRFRLSAGGRFGVLKIDPPIPGRPIVADQRRRRSRCPLRLAEQAGRDRVGRQLRPHHSDGIRGTAGPQGRHSAHVGPYGR